MFCINAQMILWLPIDYSMMAPALTGETQIQVSSLLPSPILNGQKFYFIIPSAVPVEIEVQVDGDQLILEGTTLLTVQPIPLDIPVGTKTLDRKDARSGNKLQQEIRVERFASIDLKNFDDNSPKVPGNKQMSAEVNGRWASQWPADYWWASSEMTMRYQRDSASIVEGKFIPYNTSKSRLGMESFFGAQCKGEFRTDSAARVVRGTIDYAGC